MTEISQELAMCFSPDIFKHIPQTVRFTAAAGEELDHLQSRVSSEYIQTYLLTKCFKLMDYSSFQAVAPYLYLYNTNQPPNQLLVEPIEGTKEEFALLRTSAAELFGLDLDQYQ